MNDYFVASIPLINSLGTIVQWLMFVNALLVGAVIVLAFWMSRLRERVHELEEKLDNSTPVPDEPDTQATSHPLSDDRPIPLATHRYGDASGLFKSPKPLD